MTSNMEENQRLGFVMDLVLIRKPIHECLKNLNKFEWDYKKSPFVLNIFTIKNILLKYISGEISGNDLYLWAESIEMREDIDYDDKDREDISMIMSTLSNPEINGRITTDLVNGLLSEID